MAMNTPVYYATAIVGPNPDALPFMTALVAQIQQMIKDADVSGTGGVPPLTAPAGGGPVTGKGKIT